MMEVGGIPCRLQELAGSDPERLKAAYEALSEQSVYLRFMRAKQPATAEQLAFLRQHRCDVVQGYLLSRPLPAQQCLDFIRDWPGRSGLTPLAVAPDASHAAP